MRWSWPFSSSKESETTNQGQPSGDSEKLYFFEDVNTQFQPTQEPPPTEPSQSKQKKIPPPPVEPSYPWFAKLHRYYPLFTKDPGTYDSLTQSVTGISEPSHEMHDGMKFGVQRAFGGQFMVSHEFSFGSAVEPPSYNFMSYWGGPTNTVLVGGIDHTWRTNARVIQKLFNRNLGIEFQAQATPDLKLDYVLTTDLRDGLGGHPQVRWASSQGVLAVSHAQQISEKVTAGIESIFLPKQGISGIGASMKYTGKTCGWAGMVSPLNGAAMISYYQKLAPGIRAGATLTGQATQAGDIESTVQAGVVWQPRRHGLKYKVTADTNLKVTCSYNEEFYGIGSFKFFAELDHPKNEYKFGIGLSTSM